MINETLKLQKMQIKKALSDPGMTLHGGIALVIGIIILFLIFMECMKFISIYNRTDEAIERSVIAVATQNWQNVYQSVREGYAGGNVKAVITEKEAISEEWEEVLNRDEIVKEAIAMLDLKYKDGSYVKRDTDDDLIYSIKPETLQATIINVGIEEDGESSVGTGKGLIVEVAYDVTVAWTFPQAWTNPVPITIPRTVRVQYKPMY